MTLNSSWSHIEKFLPLIHAFPFKWSSASIIFLIFIRCENLPSLNRSLFLLFVLFSFICLHWMEVLTTIQPSVSIWVTITLSLFLVMEFNTVRSMKIPFVLKNYSVWLLKYFNAVLLMPKTFNISLNVNSALYIFCFCTVWTDNE